MKDYCAEHPVLGASSRSAVDAELDDFASPAAAPQPGHSAVSPASMADALYTAASSYGIERDGDATSPDAEWIVNYAMEHVGIRSPAEFADWIGRVFEAASAGHRPRGLATIAAYIRGAAMAHGGQR